MYKALIVSIAVFFISCSTSGPVSDISFFDSYGKKYILKSAADEIKEDYGLPKAPKIILVLASEPNSKMAKLQLKAISEIDAERYPYIYVVGNSKKADRSGYFILPGQAKELLNGKKFKVILIGSGGNLLKGSTAPLTKDEIIRYLDR